MRVLFEIRYVAQPDEELWIDGDATVQMVCVEGDLYRGEYSFAEPMRGRDAEYRYHYEVRRGGEVVCREQSGEDHQLLYIYGIDVCHRRDFWSWERVSRPLSSSLFSRAVYRRVEPHRVEVEAGRSMIECRCVGVAPEHVLAVVGVSKELGHWDVERALVMADGDYPMWRVTLSDVRVHTEYKYVLLDRVTDKIVAWESGGNRIFEPVQYAEGEGSRLSVVSDLSPRFDLAPWRGVGVSIPIFSLRTERSMGVGDFGDIRNMVDWAADRGMSVLQILPINDTTMGGTWEDSYPYNANSTIALHPQYLALRDVGVLSDGEVMESFERRAAEIDALSQIDYTAVSRLKMEYMRVAFAEQFVGIKRRRPYRDFFNANVWWLEPYALFSVLRDRYSTPDFTQWGRDATYSDKLLRRHRTSETIREMEFYYFVQYHLHTQLLAATAYARSRGVALKGDIPIGISRTSVDAWIYPELFNMSSQAGAPPDPFSDLGQNWGFPTYNWGRMAEDGFAWWRSRFEKMAEYFDAYRIDHILGFFRIWEIPMGSIHGLTGQFNPALPFARWEIESAGFPLSEWHLHPCVNDFTLGELFVGADIEDVKGRYFESDADGRLRFKSEFDTQRKVAERVEDEGLREGLMLLHNEVLFVEDAHEEGRYHPRILGANSLAYKMLADWEQQCFDRLHDDFYYRRHNDFWRDSAMSKLPTLIASTDMLVCGEDLGMIPACVEEVMRREEILSLEIERMPKALGVAYGEPSEYPYMSVCTSSTHDMSTIRGWWREDRELTQRYYNDALGMGGDAPTECDADVAKRVIDRHLLSPSMLTILPWQDWMAESESERNPDVESERINVPANSRHYWRYRMHIKL